MNFKKKQTLTLSNRQGKDIELEDDEVAQLKAWLNVNVTQEGPGGWMELALNGQKIPAIQALRVRLKLGLREAKETVDFFIANLEAHEANCIGDVRAMIGRKSISYSDLTKKNDKVGMAEARKAVCDDGLACNDPECCPPLEDDLDF